MSLIFRKAALDEKAEPSPDYGDIVQNIGLLKKYEGGEKGGSK